MLRVIIQTSSFTVLIGLVQYIVGRFKAEWMYDFQWLVILYFYVLTLISLMIVERTARKDIDHLSKGFFGAMMLRFFLSIIIVLIVIYVDRENAILFAVNFIIIYLLYLGFEIYYLVKNLQPRTNGGNQYE
jgi:L-asparagine transporter-like permease